jgi:transcriptional regulator with XRE-family HTH domain
MRGWTIASPPLSSVGAQQARYQLKAEPCVVQLTRVARQEDVMARKALDPIDKHVGSRVRMRRLMLTMSQEKLGEALGITFQQVQKYEKGTNRIGSSRLHHIAGILQVPVAFFYEGAPNQHWQPDGGTDAVTPAYVTDFLTTSEGLALIRAFTRVKAPKLQRCIVHLVEAIAGEDCA